MSKKKKVEKIVPERDPRAATVTTQTSPDIAKKDQLDREISKQ